MSDESRIDALERWRTATEKKLELAVQIALGSVETIRHMQAAAEHAHAKAGEEMAAQKKMVVMFEALAKRAFDGDAPA